MKETPKPLLCFAHKGEASRFLEKENAKSISGTEQKLWEGDSFNLLISGEGLERALFELASFISFLPSPPSEIINLGVCGALKKNLPLDKVYEPSVILKESSYGVPEYRSFESLSKKSPYYLTTALERVKSDSYAKDLAKHAELVDREAWGFAYVAQKNKIPFRCIKLISDYAGEQTQCFDIKEQASRFSYLLFEYYEKHYLKIENNATTPSKTEPEFLEPRFHFSSTQKRSWDKLTNQLKVKAPKKLDAFLAEENLQILCSDYSRPKDRTRVLLEQFQNALNPFHNQIYDKLFQWFGNKPFAIKQVQTDPQWEKESIKLNIEIQTESDKKEVSKYIEELPLKDFQKIFEGEIDVP